MSKNEEVRFCIEGLIERNGNVEPTGICIDYASMCYVPCDTYSASFPTMQGAIAVLEEVGSAIDHEDIEWAITEHVWSD